MDPMFINAEVSATAVVFTAEEFEAQQDKENNL
jgi:hypothetical protein